MAPQRISRNAPCPCGSGKKYKLCCWTRESEMSPLQLRRRLGEMNRKFSNIFRQMMVDNPEQWNMETAWEDFYYSQEEDDSGPKPTHFPLFFPWMFYIWQNVEWETHPDDPDKILESIQPRLAESYLEQHGSQLLTIERKYIELNLSEGYSFYEVKACEPGSRMRLRDILLEREIDVLEKSGSKNAKVNDILYAKIIQYNDVGSIESSATIFIPPAFKPNLIDLRAQMQEESGHLTPADLLDWDDEARELYLDIFNRLTASGMSGLPEIKNMDGDPIVFHEMKFEITSPEIAFERLRPLAGNLPEEVLRENAEYDPSGKLKQVRFMWHSSDNLDAETENQYVLGQIAIDQTHLHIRVNSENRAQRIRREVEERLAEHVTFLEMDVKTLEEVRRQMPVTDNVPAASENNIDPELEKLAYEKLYKEHWKKWLNMEIPALNGMTPRQAVTSKDGKEKVEALLNGLEGQEQKRPATQPNQLKYIQWAREQLGLDS